MLLELIPVIEIGYNNQSIAKPNLYPFRDYADRWDEYHAQCYKKAGFGDDFQPYVSGLSFYEISALSENNLTKLTLDHTEDMRVGKYARNQCVAFFGGYVLKINGDDQYFPQCCGTLADIDYWENLANKKKISYAGHPAPQVEIQNHQLIFDFTVDENDELFSPEPRLSSMILDIDALCNAVDAVKGKLSVFEQRLIRINQIKKLNIEHIGQLLIWGD